MQSRLRQGLLVLMIVLGMSVRAHADPVRDFIVSCSYGVLAGTLVGAATLAFSDKPGDNLNKVARGASLGLYAGIFLGAYVVYGGPGEDDDAATQLNNVGAWRPSLRPEGMAAGQRLAWRVPEPPRVLLMPVIGERGVEGAQAQARVLSF